jgi:hypothetical protein
MTETKTTLPYGLDSPTESRRGSPAVGGGLGYGWGNARLVGGAF